MKVCPECKSRCFDDMDICYGCMYDFRKSESYNNKNMDSSKNSVSLNRDDCNSHKNHIPEYFELEPFSIDYNYLGKNHDDLKDKDKNANNNFVGVPTSQKTKIDEINDFCEITLRVPKK